MASNLIIDKLVRYTPDGEFEELVLLEGVNLIVGEPHAGKTVWLQILDHLLGDHSTAQDAFGSESTDGTLLTQKYSGAIGYFKVNGQELILERKWDTYGIKTKIKVNDQLIDVNDFSKVLFEKLKYPLIKFPKGDPFSGRTWPELSFRDLFRHIYRQENKWGDLVDKQPPKDQFAVLSLILGFANKVFPKEYEDYATLMSKRTGLEAKKEQFKDMLDSFVRNMASPIDGLTVATRQAINSTIENLNNRLQQIDNEKKKLISNGYEPIKDDIDFDAKLYRDLIQQKIYQQESYEGVINEIKKTTIRKEKIESVYKKITNELEKLLRAKDAGETFSDLKITHCPACDQKINQQIINEDHCFLCDQEISNSSSEINDRFQFEIAQLDSEKAELKELSDKLDISLFDLKNKSKAINEFLEDVNSRIAPLKSKIMSLINSKLSDLDNEKGRVSEKIKTYQRLLPNLDDRKKIASKIDSLTTEIKLTESKLDAIGANIPFEKISSVLEDGMNEYLNELNRGSKNIWIYGDIRFFINENSFQFYVGKMKWTSLSNTAKGYFYFAYHYGLMSLSTKSEFNYPNILVIDFPMEFGEVSSFKGYENYLIEPFLKLAKKMNAPNQMIFAGRSLKLDDANMIEIQKTWG